MDMNPDDLVGSIATSQILGVSAVTVHRMVRAGRLTPKHIAPGGRSGVYLFDRADVAKIAQERAEAHKPVTAPAYEDVTS